jgi:hypothetical protein
MTTVKLEVDTQQDDAKTISKKQAFLAEKVGLLSTIPLSDDLKDAFNSGLGVDPELELGAGYIKRNIKAKKNALKIKQCKVLATCGGSVALYALNDEGSISVPPFVSLVGSIPPQNELGQCKGGVSLESYGSNRERLKYLTDKGHNPNNIYLLTNKNSQMHEKEKTAWNNDPKLLVSYAGKDDGTNDATRLQWDFNGNGAQAPAKIPNGATALIISADPFFQAEQGVLVPLINNWLQTGAGRHVVYPSGGFANSPLGGGGQSTILGPDLTKAYMLLGILANWLANNKGREVGFFTVPNQTVLIP